MPWSHCALSLAAQCIVIGPVVCLFVCYWVCYHDNSTLRASIFTKLGLLVKVVTISSWLNFGRPAPGKGVCGGAEIFVSALYSQRAVFASLWALFHYTCDPTAIRPSLQLNVYWSPTRILGSAKAVCKDSGIAVTVKIQLLLVAVVFSFYTRIYATKHGLFCFLVTST